MSDAYPPPGPDRPYPGQAHPGQAFPGQAFPGQPLPGQPLPGQPLPGQPLPGQPVPGHPRTSAGFGGVAVVLGALVLVLSFAALDWVDADADTTFLKVHDAVDARAGGLNVVTQAYVRYLVVPLLLLTVVAALLAMLGTAVARIGVGVLAILGGLSLIGVVVWVESGAVGTDSSRSDALPVLIAFAVVGLVVLGLGVVAMRERRAVVARVSAGLLVLATACVHAAVLADLFDGPAKMAVGAWLPFLGFVLLLVGVGLPYRRAAGAAGRPSGRPPG